MMPNRARSSGFRPALEAFDPRILLSTATAAAVLRKSPSLQIDRDSYLVSQSSAGIQVTLNRYPAPRDIFRSPAKVRSGPIEARFWTDVTDAAGKNYTPVDQVVTFGPGVNSVTVTVPILPGAANPGELDIGLHLQALTPGVLATHPGPTPLDPADTTATSSTLAIVARSDITRPSVSSTQLTSRGIVIEFSKPMDPARLSDPRNYFVNWQPPIKSSILDQSPFLNGIRYLSGAMQAEQAPPPMRVPIARVEAGPDGRSVTLVTARKLDLSKYYTAFVGDRPGRAGDSLTDTAGNGLLGTMLYVSRKKSRP
ncbi:MAG: hypothetical protein U0800_22600 [Isosphaeraceae bacterium]